MKRLLSLLAVLVAAFVAGRSWTSFKVKLEIKRLFSASKPTTGKVFTYAQIVGLPNPVQRYFKLVLREGQPYINFVRLKHEGQFKTDLKKDWMAITGEQYFTTATPGFIWLGKTNLFSAKDRFAAGKGGLQVKLFSLIPVADGSGPKYDQGELLRWLGESAWFPTNLLPSENLSWSAINDNTALLTFTYDQLTVSYKVYFNAAGEITQMETQRYMGEQTLENWVGKFSEYQDINGIRIPTRAEGIWRLKTGDHSYANFKLNLIEYDIPESF
ncbi:DUF6544 family protein [Adhaeribacter radiodurans]|uniref:Outer membrane lipoprotein-sorting protein n=1 Tax=Adhaeribacter radiodurans TaxID=2745197 RepID=A0A7L7L1H7_9BACT|nr:DUF6544 family protein [Adhaeribacter radiodurans]QMU26638.1 hypothetical protein HUW48_00710 [Adhaeribacter radiodurans]